MMPDRATLDRLGEWLKPAVVGHGVAVLAVAILFAARFMDTGAALDPYNLLAVLALVSLVCLYLWQWTTQREIAVLAVVTAVLMAIGVVDLYTGGLRLYYAQVAVLMVSAWIVARLMVETGVFHRFALLVLVVMVALIAYRAWLEGFDRPHRFNRIFPTGSRNVAGAYVILAAAAYMAGRHLLRDRLPLWPALLVLAVAWLFATRMNILVGVLLLLAALCLRFDGKRLGWIAAGGAAAALVLWFGFPGIIDDLVSRTRFSRMGLQSARYEIWLDYLRTVPPASLLFGFPPEGSAVVADWNNNPHNSFIALYGRYGIVPFAALAWLWWRRLRAGVIHWPALVLLAVVLPRVATDMLLFGRDLDLLAAGMLVIALGFYRRGLAGRDAADAAGRRAAQ